MAVARKKIRQEIQENPIKLGGETMKEEKVIRYLGDFLSYDVSDSVHQTVVKRVGLAKKAILNIRTVVEDTRASRIGSMNVAFTIFESSVIPMVLHNSATWLEISRKTYKVLRDLFNYFFTCIFRISVGCPKPSYYWETSMLTVENYILKMKLNMLHHLKNLPEGSLGKEFLDLQLEDKSLGGIY